jgi:hypothetical protein
MSNEQRGRSAKAAGDAWERALDAYHARLTAAGVAWIVRVPTEARVMGSTRVDARGRTTFPACWQARASVDFIGVVGSRCAAVEAKTCSTERWNFAQALGAPTAGRHADVEWSTLAHFDDVGGVSVVVLDWNGAQWCVDFAELRAAREQGAGSFSVEQLGHVARRIVGPAWWRSMP